MPRGIRLVTLPVHGGGRRRHAAIGGRPSSRAGKAHTLAQMSVGAAMVLGAVLGLALGIVVSVTSDVPLAPEAGLVLGALVGWLSRRQRA
jgi:hypothetical protein